MSTDKPDPAFLYTLYVNVYAYQLRPNDTLRVKYDVNDQEAMWTVAIAVHHAAKHQAPWTRNDLDLERTKALRCNKIVEVMRPGTMVRIGDRLPDWVAGPLADAIATVVSDGGVMTRVRLLDAERVDPRDQVLDLPRQALTRLDLEELGRQLAAAAEDPRMGQAYKDLIITAAAVVRERA